MPFYKPGPDFESDKYQALLDTNPTDSTELWLIQLPLHQLQPADFNGKEIKLKEHHENPLAEFESLAGKSYEVTISGEKDLDAAACIAPGLFKNVSRTVGLVHYPEPEEFEKTRV
ncbi:hypothetical protein LUZ60_004683 [Juncus effusus]|nr:hypothetical protein LUZ60_004683 [Juncus effusus]